MFKPSFEIHIKNYNCGDGITWDEYADVIEFDPTALDSMYFCITFSNNDVIYIKHEQILEIQVIR